MLKNYDPLKVNVAFNGRQLRMFGDSLFTLADRKSTRLNSSH